MRVRKAYGLLPGTRFVWEDVGGQLVIKPVRKRFRKHRRDMLHNCDGRQVAGQAGEHVAEVDPGIVAVTLAGGQQAVMDRRRPATAFIPTWVNRSPSNSHT